jgi:hypothetical protein
MSEFKISPGNVADGEGERARKNHPDLRYFQLHIFNTFARFLLSFPNIFYNFAQF